MANTTFSIHVKPGAGKNEITEIKPEYIKIKISAPPEKNKANTELINFLSKIFGINKIDIKIISGLNSKIKMVKINKYTKDEVITRLKNEVR